MALERATKRIDTDSRRVTLRGVPLVFDSKDPKKIAAELRRRKAERAAERAAK